MAVLLIRNEYVVNFEGGELFAKIVTTILAAAGAGIVLAGIKMYFSEKKGTEKESIEKQSADVAGEPGKLHQELREVIWKKGCAIAAHAQGILS